MFFVFKIFISFILSHLWVVFLLCQVSSAQSVPVHEQVVQCQEVFLKDITSLGRAMTQRLQLRPGQEGIFETYKNVFFPYDSQRTLGDVFDIFKKYPELNQKLIVRDQVIYLQAMVFQSESLRGFVKSLSSSAGRVKNNLLNISSNVGFWMKLLNFPPPFTDKSLSKTEQKLMKTAHKEKFWKYFHQFMDPDQWEGFNEVNDHKQKVKEVFYLLDKAKSILSQQGYNTADISEAMVNLISIVGFGNKAYTELLKSENANDNMEAVVNILSERDVLSSELGFGDFSDLKKSLLAYPTPHLILSAQNLAHTLSFMEKIIRESSPDAVKKSQESLTVRALSAQESPFRGCLGGDCSTDRYFLKALDPDFLYFTLTDREYHSFGQVSVVLGVAQEEKTSSFFRVAFVDKIQGVPIGVVESMLWAVQTGLKEHGYRLVLPEDAGDHNGLSNSEVIRQHVNLKVSDMRNQFLRFKPHHAGQYSFFDGFSRAYDNLILKEWESPDMEVWPHKWHGVKFLDKRVSVESFVSTPKKVVDENFNVQER